MSRIYAIAINTFRETVRDRVLYGLLLFATLVLLFTLALGALSYNQEDRVVYDIGLASIALFSVLLAIFLGSSLLYKEIEKKTLYVVLPKPIRRYEFLLGKYFGIVVTAVVFVGTMGSLQLLVTAVQAGASSTIAVLIGGLATATLFVAGWRLRDPLRFLWPWLVVTFSASLFLCSTTETDIAPIGARLVLSLGEVIVLSAVAIFFSSFSTPFLTGGLTFGVWLAGRSADDMATMDSEMVGVEIQKLLHGVAEVIPNFNLFVPPHQGLVGADPWHYVAGTVGYGILYAAVLLVGAAGIFHRRDFV